jgi:hypothetical protein
MRRFPGSSEGMKKYKLTGPVHHWVNNLRGNKVLFPCQFQKNKRRSEVSRIWLSSWYREDMYLSGQNKMSILRQVKSWYLPRHIQIWLFPVSPFQRLLITASFNACYSIAEILKPLSQWHSIEAAGRERKLLVHADNARPHPAKLSTQYFNKNRMKSAPHSPYSPGLAPSEFYLFGYVKKCLASLSFDDADQLLEQ